MALFPGQHSVLVQVMILRPWLKGDWGAIVFLFFFKCKSQTRILPPFHPKMAALLFYSFAEL